MADWSQRSFVAGELIAKGGSLEGSLLLIITDENGYRQSSEITAKYGEFAPGSGACYGWRDFPVRRSQPGATAAPTKR